MARKPVTVASLNTSIARWNTRLRRAVRMIEKLEKQKKRVERVLAKPPKPVVPKPAERAQALMRQTIEPARPVDLAVAHPLDTSIPSFLRRAKPDPVAVEIAEQQAETKRKKSAGRIAKMKAKQAGETTRMPLTGKAALAAIRG